MSRAAPVGPLHASSRPLRDSRLAPSAGRPRSFGSTLRPADRLLWVCLSRFWLRWRDALVLVQPATVARWRRQGFWKCCGSRSRRRPGRPRIAADIRAFIRRMTLYIAWSLGCVVIGVLAARVNRRHAAPIVLLCAVAQLPVIVWFGWPYGIAAVRASWLPLTAPGRCFTSGGVTDFLVTLIALPICTVGAGLYGAGHEQR